MIPSAGSYFERSLSVFKDDVATYTKWVGASSVDSLEPKEIHEMTGKIATDLETIKWTVSVLDLESEKHKKILNEAQQALKQVGETILLLDEKLDDIIYKTSRSGGEIQKLKAERKYLLQTKDSLSSAMEMAEMAGKINPKLPSIGELEAAEGNFLGQNEADLSMGPPPSTTTTTTTAAYSTPKVYRYFWDFGRTMIFTPGARYSLVNRVPYPVSSYQFKCVKDHQKSRQEVLEIMQGITTKKKIEINLTPLSKEAVNIEDKSGRSILVPYMFNVDISRFIDRLTLNGETLIQHQPIGETSRLIGDPYEMTRSLYELFGQHGGVRIMLMCCQTIISPILNNHIASLYNKMGEWGKKHPQDALFTVNISGGDFDIRLDEKTQGVVFSTKVLMNLKSMTDGKSKGLFVAKIVVQIPLEQLRRENINGLNPEELGLHTEESVSTLIVDNEKEALEVFQKF